MSRPTQNAEAYAKRTHLSVARQSEKPQTQSEDAPDRDRDRSLRLDPQHAAHDPNETPQSLDSPAHPPQSIPIPLQLSLLPLPPLPLDPALPPLRIHLSIDPLLLKHLPDNGRERVGRGRECGVEVGEVRLRGGRLPWKQVENRVDLGGGRVVGGDGEVCEGEVEEGGLEGSEGGRMKGDEGCEEGEDRGLEGGRQEELVC